MPLIACFLLLLFVGNAAHAQLRSEQFDGLELRAIGPAAVGGRVSDIALDPENRNVWYLTTASGGVWKTTNAGTTWQPIFDRQGSYSIGVVTIDPRNPRVVWVGTGENTGQRSVGFGDGVYKSADGGSTWRRVGLERSEHIGEIAIDPRNPDIVFVAAQGPLWSSGGERGLYRTADGGRTWTRVLHVSDDTGVSDVVIDPRNPDVMFAASYQRRRHFGMQIAGGPEGAIYKSVDAGGTWRKLTRGLPDKDVGRIGLALSPQNSSVVYALIAAQDSTGGFFRSADAGETWVRQSSYLPVDPQYYMELYPDPRTPGKLYTLDVQFRVTEDEGRNWRQAISGGVHVDHHLFAFDALDPNHLINGNDGGLYQSFDGGRTWAWFANLPIAQFYHIEVDDALPFYNVYGGLQDNGSLMGRSRTLTDGIQNHDWISIGGGDGMQPRAEPGAARYVYTQSQNGSISRLDQWTGEVVSIRPPNRAGEPPHRFTWNAPLLVSPHAPTRLYFGSHKLMRSDDRGTTWQAVSGDLTRAINRDTMPVMGRTWPDNAVGRHLFTNTYSTITAIDESVLRPGLLIVGTDDGLIQISENGGQSWRMTRLPNVPDLANIVEVLASRYDDRAMYVVAQNFQRGDFKPYVFRSTDGGRTWSSIASNLPGRQVAWSIVEDHVDRNLLFLGTEFGLFFTPDSGKQWVQLRGGIPTIMVRDLAIQRRENDLVAGTFGRGVYVLDDYAPLRALTPAVLAQQGTLLPVRAAWQYHQRRNVPGSGHAAFSARNPPYGALLTYYAGASAGNLAIRITNSSGEPVAQISAPARPGVNRVAWDLRLPPRDSVVTAARGGGAGRGAGAPANAEAAGRGGRGRGAAGPPAPPGHYTAQLGRMSGAEFTPLGGPQRFEVKALPPILPARPEGS